MKPITLKMTAFGPYKDLETIEFSQLHEHGIFVVSGPTGAGKTTIFDAITFALYGAGSGQDRENSMILRSDFAEDQQDTAVELEFFVNGETYKISRSFNFQGAKKKQEILKKENGIWLNAVEKQQVRPVLHKVEELLGLTQDQFNQIVMLPQGEYQKMLTSESKEKEAIFRKLFKTEKYEKLVEILKGKRDVAEKEFSKAGVLQTTYINEIKAKLPQRESILFEVVEQPEVNLFQLHAALNEEKAYYEQQIATLAQQLNEETTNYEQKMQQLNVQKHLNERIRRYQARLMELDQLLEQKPIVEQRLQKIELAEKAAKIEQIEKAVQRMQGEVQRSNENIEALTVQQQQAAKQQVTLAAELEQAKGLAPKREQLLTDIAKQTEVLEIYKLADVKRASVSALQQVIEMQQQKVTALEARVQKGKTALAELQQQIDVNEKGIGSYEEKLDEKKKLETTVELLQKFVEVTVTVKKAAEHLEKTKQESEQQSEAYKELQKQSIQHQASLLVAQLVDGEPCPVCGSKHHENKQTEQVSEVAESALTVAADKADKAIRVYMKAQSDFEHAEKQLTIYADKCTAQQINVENAHEYGSRLVGINDALQTMRQIREQLQQQKTKRETFQKAIVDLETELLALKAEHDTEKQTYLVEKGQLEQMLASLPNKNVQAVEMEQGIRQMTAEAETIKANIETATAAYNKITVQVSNIETKLQVAQTSLHEMTRDLKAEQLQFTTALTTNGFAHVEAYVAAKLDESMRKTLVEQCQQFQQQLFATEKIVQEEAQELGEAEEQDVTVLETELAQFKEKLNKLRLEETAWKQHAKQCEETSANLKANAAQIERLKEQLTKATHLYDTVRGQNGQKISFERFVQMGYLEQVTIAANERLRYLSNNQYYLQPSDRKEGNAQSGLSLDVLDSFTGQARDVKSLSGGEKFNASLSLALGMADVIQSIQGSVHIETMFIDEGFGTLDEESLQKAIDTLIDLQQSGRIIGVISHVEELKKAMPAILEVQKLKEGFSKTKITIK